MIKKHKNLLFSALTFSLRSLTISFLIFCIFATARNLVSTTYAAEVKVIDQEVQFTQADNGFHPLKLNGVNIPGAPVNWLSPNDYYNGTWYFRYEMLNAPLNNSIGRFQVCIWYMPGFEPEICADAVRHTGTIGVYKYEESPSEWWKKNSVPMNFSNSTPFLIRSVLLGTTGCVVTRHNVAKPCWDQWPNYQQMRFRVTIVMVSRGSTFTGWDNYDFDDPPTTLTPTPPTTPSITVTDTPISPYPSIPKAQTDCFHTCVWDTQNDPPCQIRSSENMCGISADPTKCQAIDVPFVCAYAKFDCTAGSCDVDPPDRVLSPDQKVYCDEDGNPDTAATTGELYTAVGCIPVNDVNTFMMVILPLLLSIGGGVAFILIIYASFMIKSSAGDPRKLQGGRDLLTAAMAGLLLIIFSVLILRVVAVDILQIPGL